MTDEPSITAAEAYEMYHEDGMTQSQIAEQAGVSQGYISRLINGYDEGKEQGREEVRSNPEAFDLDSMVDDEPTENQYNQVEAPCCGEYIEPPTNPGEHACPSCGTVLKWSEDEL